MYAQYEYDYYHDNNNDNDNNNGFSVGLSYDPGAGLSNLALAKASESRVNSLVQSKEASRRLVLETIQTQYQQFASAQDQERSLIAAVAGAQIVVSSYRRQFIAGRKSWLEVLNAVREHSQYEIQLVESRTAVIAAYYKLQVDFGMMSWQQFDKSRQPTQLFRPLDPVKNWLNNQSDARPQTVVSQDNDMNTYPINEGVSYDITDTSYDVTGTSYDNDLLLSDEP